MIRNIGQGLLCAAALLGPAAFATTLSLNTGLDSGGALQTTSGATDAHWYLLNSSIVPDGSAAVVINSGSPDWYGGWAADGPNSSWVAGSTTTNDQGNVPWTVNIDFYLPTVADVISASLSAATWGVDDHGFVSLNGTLVSGPEEFNSNPEGINSFGGTTSGFVVGKNTLTITIDQTDHNLEAVRYEGSVTANDVSFTPVASPEPGSIALLVAGLGCIGLRFTRRSRA